jgi:hypothetical protein
MKARTGNRTIEIPEGMVRGGSGCETPYRASGSSRETAIHKTTSQRGELAPSPLPGWPKPTKQNKWNYAYAQFLELEKQAGKIRWWWYEPSSHWLVHPDKETKERGLRFKVDFMIWHNNGRLQMVEVKGYSKNLRDGLTRFKIAKEQFPCFEWSLMKRKGRGWEEFK